MVRIAATGVSREPVVGDAFSETSTVGVVRVGSRRYVGGLLDGDVRLTDVEDASKVYKLSELRKKGASEVVQQMLTTRRWLATVASTVLRTYYFDDDDDDDGTLAVEEGSSVKAHGAAVRGMASEPSCSLIATASADRTARVWDTRRKLACTHSFKHGAVVTEVAFGQRGLFLAAADETFAVWVYDLRDKTKKIRVEHAARVSCLAWTPSDLLVTASDDETVKVHSDVFSSPVSWTTHVHEALTGLVVIEDDALATCSSNSLKRWRLDIPTKTGKQKRDDALTCEVQLPVEGGYVRLLQHEHDLICVTDDAVVAFRDPLTLLPKKNKKRIALARDEILALAFVQKRMQLAVAFASSANVLMVDPETMLVSKELRGHSDVVLALARSPSGAALVTGSKDSTARVWRDDQDDYDAAAAGEDRSVELVGHVAAVSAVCFVGEDTVATSGRDKSLKLWDAKTGRAIASSPAHSKDVNGLASNGSLIATCSQDKLVKLWQPSDLAHPVQTFQGHRRSVWSAAFHPTRKLVASCASDKTLKLWHAGNGACVATLDGHEAPVLSLAFYVVQEEEHSNVVLLGGAADGRVKVWTNLSEKNPRCACTVDAHPEARVWAIAVSKDTSEIATAGADGRISLYRDATADDRAAETERRLADQKNEQALRDSLRRKDLKAALDQALDLDRPYTAYQVLKRSSGRSHDALVADWSSTRATKCLPFIREWNTDASKAFVAHSLLRALVRKFGADPLFASNSDLSRALAAYTKRHIQRIDRLHQASFLLDHALGAIKSSGQSLLPGGRLRALPTVFPEEFDFFDEQQDDAASPDDDDDDDDVLPGDEPNNGPPAPADDLPEEEEHLSSADDDDAEEVPPPPKKKKKTLTPNKKNKPITPTSSSSKKKKKRKSSVSS